MNFVFADRNKFYRLRITFKKLNEEEEDLINLMPEGVQITDLNKLDYHLLWKH